MSRVWWHYGVNRHGAYSSVVHAIRDGQALCGTNLHDAVPVGDPNFLLTPVPEKCKRCDKALAKLAAPPADDRLCRVFRLGGKDFRQRLYVVLIDDLFYWFDWEWYSRKLASDPDDWGIGAVSDVKAMSPMTDTKVVLTVPKSWRPANVRHTVR